MKSMGISIIKLPNIRKKLEDIALKLFDDNGYLKILPASFYEEQSPESLKLFCHFFARYGLPTKELVEWLKQRIGDKSAIEIGAGCGDLGRALDIPTTDNFCQTWPDVKKYKPDIVIGQWVTHWIDPNMPPPPSGGNIYGIKEDLLLKECKEYIVIGNRNVHGHKPLLKLSHQELEFSFIKSRAADPKQNVIYIW